MIVSHTAAILLYLGGRIGLAPTDEDGRLWAHQIQLTITDIVMEAYNSHHPIDEDKWFHQQKDEAIARAAVFRRAPCAVGGSAETGPKPTMVEVCPPEVASDVSVHRRSFLGLGF
jgi:hypothetical protein